MSEFSTDARTVLQAIEDLQFTGRPDPRLADLVKEFGIDGRVYFELVPLVAIYGELAPFDFKLDLPLRLLETEEAVIHSIESSFEIRTYIRPDGKTVTVDYYTEEQVRYCFAAVDGRRVHSMHMCIPMSVHDHVFPTRHGEPPRRRIDCYKITKAGRATLAESRAGLDAEFDVDALVTLNQVAPLAGLKKRTLERYLSDGKIPPPDRKGGRGKAHKWLWRNLRPALSEVCYRQLPAKFPGSRFISPTAVATDN